MEEEVFHQRMEMLMAPGENQISGALTSISNELENESLFYSFSCSMFNLYLLKNLHIGMRDHCSFQ